MTVSWHKIGLRIVLLGLAGLLAGCRQLPKASEPAPGRFVTVEKRDGRWWFVHNGSPFVERGVAVVLPGLDSLVAGGPAYNVLPAYQGDEAAWAADAAARLQDWGFNTVAAWSHEQLYQRAPLYHTRVLSFGDYSIDRDSRLIDVFSADYAQAVDLAAREQAAPHAQDTRLIGYFAGNELHWYGRRGWPTDPNISLLTRYMVLPRGAPGKIRAVEFLRRTYLDDFAAFQAEWETKAASFDGLLEQRRMRPVAPNAKAVAVEWTGVVAEEFYRLAAEAIRRHDPNHLFLGSRFAQRAQVPVLQACAKYADVISLNHYARTGQFNTNMIDAIAALTGRPIMITEFSWAAMENSSDCPNTHGADVRVATQQDRADAFERYVTEALKRPYLVGYDWYAYADQSPEGRFDGENCNYGLLDIHDRPYETLLAAIRRVNAGAENLHAAAGAWPVYDPEALADFQAIKVRGLDHALAAPVTWYDAGRRPAIYGDTANDGWIEFDSGPDSRVLHVRTGDGWGCGVSLNPAQAQHPDGSVDVLGARRIVAVVRSSKPFRFNVGVNESGHGVPGGQTYDGYGHADGEAYGHMIISAAEGEHSYEFLLANMELSQHYGNQRGNMTVDTDALSQVGLYFPGGQGDFDFEIESIQFE